MRDYWLYVIKNQREKYVMMESLFEEARKDHERLVAIVNQNVFFQEILADESKREEIVTES
jgi:hypothetical protein